MSHGHLICIKPSRQPGAMLPLADPPPPSAPARTGLLQSFSEDTLVGGGLKRNKSKTTILGLFFRHAHVCLCLMMLKTD